MNQNRRITMLQIMKQTVFLFMLGFLSAQDCPEGTIFMEHFIDGQPNNICVPTDFSTVNQSTQQAFYFFNSISINGTPILEEDWLGVFYGDICVGARQWNTSSC